VATTIVPRPTLKLSQSDLVHAGVLKKVSYHRSENLSGGNFNNNESLKLMGITIKDGNTR
jgi:hypothetical protein